MAEAERRRLSELDALRGIAAFMVVVYHYTQYLARRAHADAGGQAAPGLGWLWPFDAGEHGVALFFVISGFVIFMTLERTKKPADFLVSRFARLYPAYWGGMVLTTLVRAFSAEPVSPGQFLVNLTMVASWFHVPFVEGVYWTLGVELQFYLLMLGVSVAGGLGKVEWFCVGWFGLAFAALVGARLGAPAIAVALLRDVFILPHAMLFAAGMMFYRMFSERPTLLRSALVGVALAACWLTSPVSKAVVVTLTFAVFALFLARRIGALGEARPLVFLGRISYPLYLVHLSAGVQTMELLEPLVPSPALRFAAAVGVSLGLAAAVHAYVEEPGREIIRAWYARRRAGAAASLA